MERKILVFMRTVAIKTAGAGELRLIIFPAAEINRRAGNALVAVKVKRRAVSGTIGGVYSTAIDNRRVEALVPIEGRILLTVEIGKEIGFRMPRFAEPKFAAAVLEMVPLPM